MYTSNTPKDFGGNTPSPVPRRGSGRGHNPFRGLRTLIVEDNAVDQKMVLAACEQLALRVDVVDNGADAIDRLRQAASDDPYELVLLDFKLPNMDGLTASKYIKRELKLPSHPKILLLSAYSRDEVFFTRDDRSFVDAFVTKPVLMETLEHALGDLRDRVMLAGGSWPEQARGGEDNSNEIQSDDQLLSRCRVLLAEDNEINQRVAVGLLNRRGVEVVVAHNGQEAVDIIFASPTGRFDIVLMDVDMPLLDGYDATKTLRRHPDYNQLPIIALTAHNSPRDRERCLEAGMSEYLTKPIKPQFLYDAMLRFLR